MASFVKVTEQHYYEKILKPSASMKTNQLLTVLFALFIGFLRQTTGKNSIFPLSERRSFSRSLLESNNHIPELLMLGNQHCLFLHVLFI